jgi:hypothetical protein
MQNPIAERGSLVKPEGAGGGRRLSDTKTKALRSGAREFPNRLPGPHRYQALQFALLLSWQFATRVEGAVPFRHVG